jgi:predicted transcriptional regulator
MTTLTIQLQDAIKKESQKKAKNDGLTLTFVVSQALKAYAEGKLSFGLLSQDDITASFDISTSKGKKACIQSFESLIA